MSELVKSDATLNRNDVEVPLFIGTFGKLAKENAGKKFLYPILDIDHFDRDVTMIGKEYVADTMTKNLRRIFGSIMVECWDKDTGELNQDLWNEMVADFTEGEEKRETLQSQKNDLSDEFASYTEGDDFTGTPEQVQKIEGIAAKISAINVQLKAIQVKIDEKTAKRNATKAKNAEILAKRQNELKLKKETIAKYAEAHKVTIEAATAHFAKLEAEHANT